MNRKAKRRARYILFIPAVLAFLLAGQGCRGQVKMSDNQSSYRKLTSAEERVIMHKGTEMPYSGKYYRFDETGTYLCKRCSAPLYRSADKFDSRCGWPSFDDELPGAVKRVLDTDGIRTEIQCAGCGAHLGHVFEGEGLTPKNIRHCVNSISLEFVPAGPAPVKEGQPAMEQAVFAAGCFWGVEYHLRRIPGVLSTAVGYTGGKTTKPSYQEVCRKQTGHAEAVKVIFDPARVEYAELVKFFFEIHDFTQVDRQGPDIGDQYRSAIFYTSPSQRNVAEQIIGVLQEKGYRVATRLEPAATFWQAEDYHQDYYENNGQLPYCHSRRKIF